MDEFRFDTLTRTLAAPGSRRRVLMTFGGALGSALGAAANEAAAKRRSRVRPARSARRANASRNRRERRARCSLVVSVRTAPASTFRAMRPTAEPWAPPAAPSRSARPAPASLPAPARGTQRPGVTAAVVPLRRRAMHQGHQICASVAAVPRAMSSAPRIPPATARTLHPAPAARAARRARPVWRSARAAQAPGERRH